MVSIMSYQYPPLPNTPEVDMSHPGYAPGYSAPAPGPPMMVPRSHDQSIKEREESFPQASLKLKRSRTKPNVRPRQANIPDPSQAALANDKKRNKLGYHRTSVACGHCRRRKIRCIPSPSDTLGRCINCIRLKKECSFYPVDQPPAPQSTEARPKAPSRASTGPKVTSASSSPAMAPGQSPDMSQYQQYRHVAMPPANMAPPAMRPAGVEGVPSGASSSSRSFDFQGQQMANWMPHDAASGAAKPSNLNETWTSYPQESPITPSFSPYTPQGPGPAGWGTAINTDPNIRDEMNWTSFVPAGSVPFPGQAQMPNQFAGMPQGRSFGRKSSTMSMDMYSTPLATSVAGFDPQGASLSAGAVPPAGYGSWEQPYTYTKSSEGGYEWSYDDSREQ
ncbi:fungal zn binuclear cluster domain containing protein [Colletotrichum chrysophilum]|uniref:Fungal zn binuclear cluster domain containing protein n=2 Tax=Colletotrichum chrysophilum TaxID=1836956 RepID=A0AAD9ANW0_9PEZI|nr:fungal zn binuclear cluster domain containing protein [Colletotrichum chrysophilum]